MNISTHDPVLEREAKVSVSGAVVRLRGVTRSFGARTVLRGIDLDIPAGQFVAIVGRSGCGKSTLLRLIAGLDRPDAGEIDTGDQRTRLMFQEPRLLPWLRVAANVAVGLAGANPDEAGAVLARVGLEGRGGDWPAVLSGGQQQRVALARALAGHPGLLALDEPLGALDALTRIEMRALITEVWLDQGFTAIVVTHDVAEAVDLADRILLIEDGVIAMDVITGQPRPRRRGDAQGAAIEGRVLDRLLGRAR